MYVIVDASNLVFSGTVNKISYEALNVTQASYDVNELVVMNDEKGSGIFKYNRLIVHMKIQYIIKGNQLRLPFIIHKVIANPIFFVPSSITYREKRD